MKNSKEITNDKYFGNLTIKGIKEINFEASPNFTPQTWGWPTLVLAIIAYLQYKKYKKNRKKKFQLILSESISSLENKNQGLVEVMAINKICARKYLKIAKSNNEEFFNLIDPENIYFEQSLRQSVSSALYKKESEEDLTNEFTNNSLNWLRSLS